MWAAMEEIASLDAVGQIPIARCRELLGDEAVGLSDEDVDQIRQHADAMAHVLIDIFLARRATVH